MDHFGEHYSLLFVYLIYNFLKLMWVRVSFLDGSVAKNLLAKQKMQNWSLVGEDTLEKEMATHSSILIWETRWT